MESTIQCRATSTVHEAVVSLAGINILHSLQDYAFHVGQSTVETRDNARADFELPVGTAGYIRYRLVGAFHGVDLDSVHLITRIRLWVCGNDDAPLPR